ncbi:Aminoacyl-tRNA synthetase [Melampsora americana]|nr:Aminoacyl-tRNA synthetase [Melampsora americana]
MSSNSLHGLKPLSKIVSYNPPTINLRSFSSITHHLQNSSSIGSSQSTGRFDRVIFSGIQPTGVPHIGNYLGALKNWVKLQNENIKEIEGNQMKLFYSIVGLHALTLPQLPEKLKFERFEMMCTLLSIGLNPSYSCLFNQDEVSAHSELTWILNCITPVGRLNRMTTWKQQLGIQIHLKKSMNHLLHLGLLAYPVLQSADILLYKSTHVPVGEDQEQHIELTRMIAKSFNKHVRAKIFPIPRPMFAPQARILNLRNPEMKMSKSHPSPTSRILITDTPTMIQSKIQSAVTDSISQIKYDRVQRPGVSNLLDIYAGFSDLSIHRTHESIRRQNGI